MTSEFITELKVGVGEYGLAVVPSELPDYCGIKDVGFLYNGCWSDPELEYKGKIYNAVDFEDCAWELFEEEQKDYLVKANTYDDFTYWLKHNPDTVYSILEDLIPVKVK